MQGNSAPKRRHHFVPRFYLRKFSSAENRIHVFNLMRKLAVPHASLRNQCYRHRLYGKSDDLENAFAELEAIVAPIIQTMLSGLRPPDRGSDDSYALRAFVGVQLLRTQAALARTQEAAAETGRKAFDGAPPPAFVLDDREALALSLRSLPMMVWALEDLSVQIIQVGTETFVSSDHPVSRFNSYCHGIEGVGVLGANCRGLQIVVPLSPTTAMMLYDGSVYRVLRGLGAEFAVATIRDVALLNQLQILTANENIYFADWEQRQCLADILDCTPRGSRIRVVRAEEVGNERRELIATHETQPEPKMALSFVEVRRAAARVPWQSRIHNFRQTLPGPMPRVPPPLDDGRTHIFRVRAGT